jgi:ketosteroid isomerase-like protein
MTACNSHPVPVRELSATERAAIERAVKQTASDLLTTKDAATVVSFYAPDPTVVSNGFLYPSFDALATELEAFYGALREINLAVWDDNRVDVLSANAAVFTGRFRWSSRDSDGVRLDLQGVWTGVFVREGDRWKIQVRHESFEPLAE